jgi:alkylation response protein AidB-like acyl-CoA dehydrogenase
MAILLATNKSAAERTVEAWRQALLAVDPALDIRSRDEAPDPAEIDVVVMWGAQDLAALTNEPAIGPDWAPQMAPAYLMLRAASIYGGTNEIQKNILNKAVLGL